MNMIQNDTKHSFFHTQNSFAGMTAKEKIRSQLALLQGEHRQVVTALWCLQTMFLACKGKKVKPVRLNTYRIQTYSGDRLLLTRQPDRSYWCYIHTHTRSYTCTVDRLGNISTETPNWKLSIEDDIMSFMIYGRPLSGK